MEESLLVPCARCAGVNRVASRRLADSPSCGRCKSPLLLDSPIALDDFSFETYVARSDLPVIVDFWAAWCGPCKMMTPRFEAAARAASGRALFAMVDADAAKAVAAQLGIHAMPTLIGFKHGRELARQSGAMSQNQILRWVSAHCHA